MAKIDDESVMATIDAPTMAGRRKSLRSSIGSDWRHSAMTKTASRTAEPPDRPRSGCCPSRHRCPAPGPRRAGRERPRTTRIRSSRSDAGSAPWSRPATSGQGDGDGHDADGHVDEEDPAPAEAAGDGATDERSDGDGSTDDPAVDAEGGSSLLALEGGGDEGQRGGEHDGPADPLGPSGQVQHEGRSQTARTRATTR
jgi:hypothetical protein